MDTDSVPKASRAPRGRRTLHSHGGGFARITAWAIFLAVTAGYLLFRHHGAEEMSAFIHRFVLRTPGLSLAPPPNLNAFLRVRATHLELLWNAIATFAIDHLSQRRAEGTLKAMSCICGGLSASLLFASVRCMVLLFLRGTPWSARQRKTAAWTAGTVAAAILAVNQPSWIAVGWLRPEFFDLAIIMVTAWFFTFSLATGRFRPLCICAFLYGLMLFETGDLIRILPLAVVATVFLMARAGLAKLGNALALGGLLLAGAAYYLALVWLEYAGGQIDFPTALSDTNPCWFAVVSHVRDSFLVWPRQSVNQLAILMAIAPWAVSCALGSWTLGRTATPADIVLHLILAVTAVVGLSNCSMSPWGILGPMMKAGAAAHLPLPCFPQALQAATCGYLVGWGVLQSGGSLWSHAPAAAPEPDDEDGDPDEYYISLEARVVHHLARALAWVLLLFALCTCVLNAREDIRHGIIPDERENSIFRFIFNPRQ